MQLAAFAVARVCALFNTIRINGFIFGQASKQTRFDSYSCFAFNGHELLDFLGYDVIWINQLPFAATNSCVHLTRPTIIGYLLMP
jgi:hypothetical protein